MQFGYARVSEREEEQNLIRRKMLELIGDDRFVFMDLRKDKQGRNNYLFMRNMLRTGDVLYIDAMDSLGHDFAEIAREWSDLTQTLGIDVVVLDSAGALDSRKFHSMGELGQQLEMQMLYLLTYMGELQQRDNVPPEPKEHKKLGRPAIDWDWDLFDATAQRWADGEIDARQACDIMDSARSSWYKYAKERGYKRKVNRKR